jgi:hypothetical protein
MNLPELIIFLVVTGSAGAGVGALVGLCTGNVAAGAGLGALLGPIVGAVAMTMWGVVAKLQSKNKRIEDRTSH